MDLNRQIAEAQAAAQIGKALERIVSVIVSEADQFPPSPNHPTATADDTRLAWALTLVAAAAAGMLKTQDEGGGPPMSMGRMLFAGMVQNHDTSLAQYPEMMHAVRRALGQPTAAPGTH